MGDVGKSDAVDTNPCPVCSRSDIGASANGGTLILRQINATEAIYVCDNPECVYPVGEEITVVRSLVPELMSDLERSMALESKEIMPSSMNSDPAYETGAAEGSDVPTMLPVMTMDQSPAAESSDVPTTLPVMTMDPSPSESWYDSLAGPEVCDWLDSLTD